MSKNARDQQSNIIHIKINFIYFNLQRYNNIHNIRLNLLINFQQKKPNAINSLLNMHKYIINISFHFLLNKIVALNFK